MEINDIRTGLGFDVHRLVEGRDADVALHALSDALLGAASLRDIGYHFPPTDDTWKGADSMVLLRKVAELVADKGYRISNVDITIIAQAPKLLGYIPEMQARVADCLELDPDRVAVKATTTEHLGYTGRKEGIAAMATALILR